MGTADYLAPEQITAPDQVGPVSDIYSLGVTLYYAVTGKVPFAGGSAKDKARRHVEDPPINPRRLNPELTDEFITVIGAMMEKNPAKRVQSAGEVIQLLSSWASSAFNTSEEEVARQAYAPRNLPDPLLPLLLSDAATGFFAEPLDAEEIPSQISQSTDPASAALEETVPEYLQQQPPPAVRSHSPVILVAAVLVPLMAAAVVLLASVVVKALW